MHALCSLLTILDWSDPILFWQKSPLKPVTTSLRVVLESDKVSPDPLLLQATKSPRPHILEDKMKTMKSNEKNLRWDLIN